MRERTKAVNVRVTNEERRMLRAIARQRDDESASQIIRRFIREEFARTFPNGAPTARRKRVSDDPAPTADVVPS